jgi:hypothetical protein
MDSSCGSEVGNWCMVDRVMEARGTPSMVVDC